MKRTFLQRTLDGFRTFVPAGDGYDVTALSAPDRARFFTYYDSARARLEGAAVLRESGRAIPALLLYRDGYSMLARAHAATASSDGVDDAAAVERFTEWVASKHEPSARVLRKDLSLPGESPDGLNHRELAVRIAELGAVMPDVLGLMAPRPPGRAARRRVVRNCLIAVGLLASIVAIVAFIVRPENIALHKRATSSSLELNTKPSGAVNGRIYEPYGFHTGSERSPWLRIDLGRAYDITRVRVFGRHDCCFDQSIPIGVEFSSDGETFTDLEERTTAFDQLDPWEIVPGEPVRARYVRVRTLKHGMLVLSEVEVYGNAVR